MSNKICSNCGEINSSSLMTCSNCSSSLVNTKITDGYKELQIIQKTTCPECGVKIKEGTRNCKHCGAFIAKTQTSYTTNKQSSYTTSNHDGCFTYMISFIIPLVGIIVGAIYLTNDDSTKKHIGKVCILLGLLSNILGVLIIHNFLF